MWGYMTAGIVASTVAANIVANANANNNNNNNNENNDNNNNQNQVTLFFFFLEKVGVYILRCRVIKTT